MAYYVIQVDNTVTQSSNYSTSNDGIVVYANAAVQNYMYASGTSAPMVFMNKSEAIKIADNFGLRNSSNIEIKPWSKTQISGAYFSKSLQRTWPIFVSSWDPVVSIPSGLVVDLYPGDSSTLTLDGTKVAAIRDRSSNAYSFAQGAATYQPTIVLNDSTFKGKNSISWGTNVLPSATAIAMGGSGKITIAWVDYIAAPQAASRMQFSMGTYRYGKSAVLFRNSTEAQAIEVNRTGSSQAYISTLAISTGAVHVFIMTMDIESATETSELYLDDGTTPIKTFSSAAGSPSTFDDVTWYIGAGTAVATYAFKDKIARVTAWNRILSASEIQTVMTQYTNMFI